MSTVHGAYCSPPERHQFDDPRLPKPVRHIIADPHNEILVSAASAWEITTKHRIGKLSAVSQLVQDISGWVRRAGFKELKVSIEHAQRAGAWTSPHRDPFDRMLAAQSAIEQIPLITGDRAFQSFGVSTVWPS